MATALIGTRSLFIHVPRTGGMWAGGAMRVGGLELRAPPPLLHPVKNERHPPLSALSTDSLFAFGFVRHPLTWWQSFWRYRMERGWKSDHEIDSVAQADDFDRFIENVLQHLPGWLSNRYTSLVGPPGGEIDFIGRFENLPDDLIRALRMAGETFNERRLLAAPPRNVAGTYRAVYGAGLAEQLLEAEAEAVERFYLRLAPPAG